MWTKDLSKHSMHPKKLLDLPYFSFEIPGVMSMGPDSSSSADEDEDSEAEGEPEELSGEPAGSLRSF